MIYQLLLIFFYKKDQQFHALQQLCVNFFKYSVTFSIVNSASSFGNSSSEIGLESISSNYYKFQMLDKYLAACDLYRLRSMAYCYSI